MNNQNEKKSKTNLKQILFSKINNSMKEIKQFIIMKLIRKIKKEENLQKNNLFLE